MQRDKVKLKMCAYIPLKDVETYAKAHQLGILNEHAGIDNWMHCQVNAAHLRNMHGDFGRPDDGYIELQKGELYIEQLASAKDSINTGHFPRYKVIRDTWLDKPTVLVQRTLSSGELYVIDGVTRTLNALYHGEKWLDAFVITIDQEREVR